MSPLTLDVLRLMDRYDVTPFVHYSFAGKNGPWVARVEDAYAEPLSSFAPGKTVDEAVLKAIYACDPDKLANACGEEAGDLAAKGIITAARAALKTLHPENELFSYAGAK